MLGRGCPDACACGRVQGQAFGLTPLSPGPNKNGPKRSRPHPPRHAKNFPHGEFGRDGPRGWLGEGQTGIIRATRNVSNLDTDKEVRKMAGKRQPTDIVKANGRKHMSQGEEDARRDREVHVPSPERAEPPRWLSKKFHAEFREIGEILRQSGLYTELDRDVLAQFLVARERWVRADKLASAAIGKRDEKLAREWTGVQGTYFKQCRQCAEAMGLSITSRCRLVVPEVMVNAARAEAEEDEFTRRLKQRQEAALAQA